MVGWRKEEALAVPRGCKAALVKTSNGFEVCLQPPMAGWFWERLSAKSWPAARKQAPGALRSLLRSRADWLRREAADLTQLAIDLEGFAEGLGYVAKAIERESRAR